MEENIELIKAIDSYRKVLSDFNAASGKVIVGATDEEIEVLQNIESISLHPDLITYFKLVNGYDDEKCDELDVYEPEFAWGMFSLSTKFVKSNYENLAGCGGDENPNYWPQGFLPILENGGGSYVVINCIADSQTYGAVYDMSDGVGCNRISDSLTEFINACTKELELGLRVFSNSEISKIKSIESYLSDCLKIYGEFPYFIRTGKMGEQIVDWH